MPEDNVQYPYDLPPGVTAFNYLIANPRRVTRSIARIALQNFYVDQIFSPIGGQVLGAAVYEQRLENDLYPDDDVEKINPGDEFPTIGFSSGDALTAQVEKFGGKFPVTDEAVRRNQGGRVLRAMGQVANVIRRKTQQRALAELQANITLHNRTAVGSSWSAGAALANGDPQRLIRDLTAFEETNATLELDYTFDLAIMSPGEWRNFRLTAGGDAGAARQLLRDSGINDVWVTNRKTNGSVYWVSRGQVGELGYELPLYTTSHRDPHGKEQTWFQTGVLPIMYVTDPFAILETTGHRV